MSTGLLSKCAAMTAVVWTAISGLNTVGSASAETVPPIAWTRQIGASGIENANAVGVDGIGNIYVSGTTTGSLGGPNAGNADAFLSKYSTAGTLLWSRQFGSGGTDSGYGLAADKSGNVYVSGLAEGVLGGSNSTADSLPDAFLTKYDSNGVALWSRQSGALQYDYSTAVAVDSGGNAYISGTTSGNIGGANAGLQDAFLSKYDPAGTLLWSRQAGTTGYDEGRCVAVDGTGSVYITGPTAGNLAGTNAGAYDTYLSKYDSAGTLLWSRQFGTDSQDISNSVIVDVAGNVYIGGRTSGSLGGPNAGNDDAFLTKFDSAGTQLWTRQIGTKGDESGAGLALDSAGNILMSGTTNASLGGPTAGSTDAFLAKFDSGGALLWLTQLGTNRVDSGSGVAVDGIGNIFLAGSTEGALGGPNPQFSPNAFLVKFAVPEPSVVVLVAMGVVAVVGSGRRVGR